MATKTVLELPEITDELLETDVLYIVRGTGAGRDSQMAASKIFDISDKASVSSNDTTPGYLNGKLVAGTNVTLTEGNDGGNETLTISAEGGVSSAEFSCGVKVSGLLYVADSIDYIDIPFSGTLTKIIAKVGVAPDGGAATFDLREGDTKGDENTTSILNSVISIAADTKTASVTSFAVTDFTQGDRLWLNCDLTTGNTASDLQITLLFTKV
jgi:hypothetical protein